jgi:beta-glucosidase
LTSLTPSAPASALPNATAIGASFNTELVAEAGALLAAESKARHAVCLLAPTINIQRSPLGGRAFESFSEDPTHSGLIAAAYVNGLQAEGVSATIKHFVANDQEHERMGEDSIIAPRPLREVYLRPFQIAQKLAKPWAYMTSYNKLNGTHCSENEWLLDTVLRKEWKHEGLIMSDWFGTYSVSEAIAAGLNLEMPGPARWRSQELVQHLIGAHKVDRRQLDKLATELLKWVQFLAKANESVVYAKPQPEETRTSAMREDAKIIRKIGTEGIVLLKNDKAVLPVAGKKVAVIGPNAKAKVLTGGGSAQLRSAWSQTPWEGLVNSKPSDVTLEYSLGAFTAKFLPMLGQDFTCLDGSPGFDLCHYAIQDGKKSAQPTIVDKFDVSDMFMADFKPPELGDDWVSEVKAIFTSPVDGEYEFGLAVTGQGWLYVDDQLVIDNSKNQKRGSSYFGNGTIEAKGQIKVQKGKVSRSSEP